MIAYPKILVFICVFWMVGAFSGLCFAVENTPRFERDTLMIRTKTGDKVFNIELAKSAEQQEYGLMYRKELAENSGMIFLSKAEKYASMWMKNTLIPLDMLFIDRTGKIIYIAQETQPESLDIISAGQKTLAVLEIAGGQAQQQNIQIGDMIIYEAFGK